MNLSFKISTDEGYEIIKFNPLEEHKHSLPKNVVACVQENQQNYSDPLTWFYIRTREGMIPLEIGDFIIYSNKEIRVFHFEERSKEKDVYISSLYHLNESFEQMCERTRPH